MWARGRDDNNAASAAGAGQYARRRGRSIRSAPPVSGPDGRRVRYAPQDERTQQAKDNERADARGTRIVFKDETLRET